MKQNKIIGIDLGTTNSCVAIMEDGQPKILVNDEGARTTPSVVAYTKDGDRLVGQIAKRQAITNPENTIYSSKRFIGRKYSEVQDELKLIPYKVVSKNDGKDIGFSIQGKVVSPEEVGAAVLSKLKKVAEDYLGHEVTDAVITVPAYFNESQRQATKNSGKIAGLNVLRIINEPTAAALAYGMDKKKNQKIFVSDAGGGTTDTSVLEVGEGIIEVKATSGDSHLGGDNFDQSILEFLVNEFKKDQGFDLSSDKMALQRLKEASEKAKIELSSSQETEINLPFITADQSGPKHLQIKLSRSKFDQMTAPLVKRIMKACEMAMKDSGIKISDIDEVLLVGGSTRIPSVQKALKDYFGKDPNKSVNPDEVVALGAAVQGGILAGDVKDVLLLDVNPLSLGIETLGGVMTALIERNTTIPARKTQMFATAEDNQPAVDIHVLQGERKMAADNKTLGRFQLTGLPQGRRNEVQVEVSFDVDANGILSVTAKDTKTGKNQSIKITAQSGLTEDQVKEMVKESESQAEADKEKFEVVQARNELDNEIYQSSKSLTDLGEKLAQGSKDELQSLIDQAKKVLDNKSSSVSDLKQQVSALHTKVQELTQQSNSSGSDSTAETNKKSDDDVIDADFKDVK